MANSRRYRALVQRLAALRRHFLPKQFSPTGTYSSRVVDHARGYSLLAHAEIESFIEDISRSAVLKKSAEWKSSRKTSDLLLCFLASYHSGFGDDEDESSDAAAYVAPLPPKSRPKIKDNVVEALDKALSQYLVKVTSNHGVRQKNIKALVLPVGVRLSDLDPMWITNLDNFGKLRGEIAHNHVGTHRLIDPQTELHTVQQLLVGLQKLDELITARAK